MEIPQQQQVSSKVVWESKIKGLEEEKLSLQQEIGKIKDLIAVTELERKFKALEEEVLQLRSMKTDLEGQLIQRPNATTTTTATVERSAQPTDAPRPAQPNRPSNEVPRPLRRFAF